MWRRAESRLKRKRKGVRYSSRLPATGAPVLHLFLPRAALYRQAYPLPFNIIRTPPPTPHCIIRNHSRTPPPPVLPAFFPLTLILTEACSCTLQMPNGGEPLATLQSLQPPPPIACRFINALTTDNTTEDRSHFAVLLCNSSDVTSFPGPVHSETPSLVVDHDPPALPPRFIRHLLPAP